MVVINGLSELFTGKPLLRQFTVISGKRLQVETSLVNILTCDTSTTTVGSAYWQTLETTDAAKLSDRYKKKVNTSDPEVVRALATSGIQLQRRRAEELIRDSQRSAVTFLHHAETGTALPAAAAGVSRFRD